MLPEMAPREHKLFTFFLVLTLALLCLFLASKTWLALKESHQVGKPVPYEYSISVEGIGESTVVPDIAKLSYSIDSRGATTQESQEKNAAVGNAIVERVGTEGIEKKDVKTISYTSYQNYKYDENNNSIPGGDWSTTQSVEITVRDTSKISSMLTLLGQLGATGISGPTFAIENDEAAKDEARVLALADVKKKAQQIASSLGLELNKISSYSEYMDTPYYGYGMGGAYDSMSTKAASPSVEAGSQKTKLHVTVSYTLK